MLGILSLFSLAGWFTPTVQAPAPAPIEIIEASVIDRGFNQTIAKVEGMVWDQRAQSLARKHGLSLVNVSWEDTGRHKGSSVGPNISDMTIGVRDAHGSLHPMPVFRFDNFNDKTADIKADNFYVRTGNEDGKPLEPTSLKDLLETSKTIYIILEAIKTATIHFSQAAIVTSWSVRRRRSYPSLRTARQHSPPFCTTTKAIQGTLR